MTGSIYKAIYQENTIIKLERYPDAGENPYTALLIFYNDEHGVGMSGETLRLLLEQLKNDDPKLFKFLTETEKGGPANNETANLASADTAKEVKE